MNHYCPQSPSECVWLCFQTGLGGGSLLSLSDAVSQAARTAGVRPITSAEELQDELETQEMKEAYAEQVGESVTDVKTKQIQF